MRKKKSTYKRTVYNILHDGKKYKVEDGGLMTAAKKLSKSLELEEGEELLVEDKRGVWMLFTIGRAPTMLFPRGPVSLEEEEEE